ncbi:hypothetical protein UFOVP164_29 [uncultured Caudovirales phage]|uniref:Uncharacterized protein n=1 Tax=uncultured Caudovirales phage TaxID=2100421 RepID=A0A6J7XRF7_9CAUD|nr:hypothetical protein UFOVP164_29 [uncultured Caudovirales phage]
MIDRQTKPGEYISPAFPTGIITDDKGMIIGGSNGMTLRDYFAAKAMQGFLQYSATKGIYTPPDNELAKASYDLADAMLKARQE